MSIDKSAGIVPLIQERKNSLAPLWKEDSKRSNSFEDILKQCITPPGHKDETAVREPSLDKGKIMKLIQAIRYQVNDYMNRMIRDETWPTDSWGMDGLAVLEMSKIRHNFKNTPGTDMGQGKYFEHIIEYASETYGVDPSLIRSVIKAESNFEVNCTSSKGAMGLMQLMPETARELGISYPNDPFENIMGGTRYLSMLLDRYDGDIPLALAAYNWGMGNLEGEPGNLPRETVNYVARINKFYLEEKS